MGVGVGLGGQMCMGGCGNGWVWIRVWMGRCVWVWRVGGCGCGFGWADVYGWVRVLLGSSLGEGIVVCQCVFGWVSENLNVGGSLDMDVGGWVARMSIRGKRMCGQ